MSDTHRWRALDKTAIWHPFTQMRDWCALDHEPLVLTGGDGALLYDSDGKTYIDGNSSIWTNLHGHRNPRLDAALKRQLDRVAHTSFLGYTNPLAIELASRLCKLWPRDKLTRCFFTDDGSTAIEVALKMAAQFWQLSDQPRKTRFVAFNNAYHGDTMGASSLGGIARIHDRFAAWQFPVVQAAAMDDLVSLDPGEIAAVCIEPIIQGAAGMRLWPQGMLKALRAWCDQHDVFLIADEVMTGFGRTGKMFACEHEDVVPDFVALAKGLTGGYLPLAATLTTERVYSAFLGDAAKTLYYGHSYCGNQLGCSVALENLAIFESEKVMESLQRKIELLRSHLASLRSHPNVAEIRQCGFIAGIELTQGDDTPVLHADNMLGAKVCLAARKHGLLTRPIQNTVVLMPPYCITDTQLAEAVDAVRRAISETFNR